MVWKANLVIELGDGSSILSRSLLSGNKVFNKLYRGALTIFVAVCAVFILPDFPETEYFLSPLEVR